MKEGGESLSLPMAAHRRSLGGRKGLESASVGSPSGYASYLSRSVNSPSQEPVPRKSSPSNSEADGKSILKGRSRRASEGGQMKSDGKRNPADLRCDRCGKGYKHGSCLSKHMCVFPPPLWRLFVLSCPIGPDAPCRLCTSRLRGPSNSPPSFFPVHSPDYFFWWHPVDLVFFGILGGNTTQPGTLPRNFSSPSTSRSSCLKRLPCWLT